MRAEHLTAAETQAYAMRTLPADAALTISDHLVGCAECRAIVRQAEQFQAGRPAAEPVTYEELAAVIDNELDPLGRAEVMAKIARSPEALAELRDLQHFKQQMAEAAPGTSRRSPAWKRWALPLAAALTAGIAFLWWSASSQPREGGFVLRDHGARLQIAPNGSVLGLGELPPELRASLKEALSQNRMHVPKLVAGLKGQPSTLAGTAAALSETLRALAPVAVVVEEDSPVFRWDGDARATGYRVIVARAGGDEIVEAGNAPATATQWKPTKPLAAGEEYQWQVQAVRNGDVIATAPAPPEPVARFRVLGHSEREKLERTKSGLSHSHLGSALAYAQAGVIDKADAELAELEKENADSVLPGQLRAALKNATANAD